MNLTEFMKKVDLITESMSADNMAAFLHDYARSISEPKREEFLERLSFFKGKNVDAGYIEKQDKLNKEHLKQEVKKNRKQLELIDSGELTLVEVQNVEYNEWYDSSDEEFFYEDPEYIGEAVQKGCSLVHACADSELYQEGYELADFLFEMNIEVEGEFGGDDFSLQDLEYHKIISLDYETFVLEALAAAYWGNEMPERPEALYRILLNASSREASLEKLMQQSRRELDRFSEFLSLWIDYLGKIGDRVAERFLQEAVSLADDPEALLSAARKYTDLHPGLYVQALEKYKASDETQQGLQIGKEALERILPVYQIRSRAALLTAEFALGLEDRTGAERCWLEAFRSDSSVENYLRLMLECEDGRGNREEARRIYTELFSETAKAKAGQYQTGERKENSPEHRTYDSLLFFDGRFGQLIEKGMDDRYALGWSGTFMKEGLALFLLYFYEGRELLEGGREMCRKYVSSVKFQSEAYLNGTGRDTKEDDQGFFWECFLRWRERISISEEETEGILEKLENWIQMRVEGIMDKSHRNYYGECAAFIAALGEVRESRGELAGKAKLMEEYRSRYSRRTAFHQELRGYGMADTRKR